MFAAALISFALTAAAPVPVPAAEYTRCADYSTQPQAQRAWENSGRPASADPDGDGVVCESLPAENSDAGDRGCVRTKKVIRVRLDRDEHAHVLDHARDAVRAGWPRIMVLNRRGADARRERLLRDIPTRDGFDRDEYPAAAGRGKGKGLQRGRNPRGWKASVRHIRSAENRSAGAILGNVMERYCNGTRFHYQPADL